MLAPRASPVPVVKQNQGHTALIVHALRRLRSLFLSVAPTAVVTGIHCKLFCSQMLRVRSLSVAPTDVVMGIAFDGAAHKPKKAEGVLLPAAPAEVMRRPLLQLGSSCF